MQSGSFPRPFVPSQIFRHDRVLLEFLQYHRREFTILDSPKQNTTGRDTGGTVELENDQALNHWAIRSFFFPEG